jgi:hypothetical protein
MTAENLAAENFRPGTFEAIKTGERLDARQ